MTLEQRLEAAEKACAEMRDALVLWRELYKTELLRAEQSIESCRRDKDEYGKNFFQGKRIGLVGHDIIFTKLKRCFESTDCGKDYVHRRELDEANSKLTHVLTSLEEGTLPWWQKKHDDAVLQLFEFGIELVAMTAVLNRIAFENVCDCSGPVEMCNCPAKVAKEALARAKEITN